MKVNFTNELDPISEDVIRANKKKYHVMRFNGVLNIDFTKWTQVKLERENNMRDARVEEEQPK